MKIWPEKIQADTGVEPTTSMFTYCVETKEVITRLISTVNYQPMRYSFCVWLFYRENLLRKYLLWKSKRVSNILYEKSVKLWQICKQTTLSFCSDVQNISNLRHKLMVKHCCFLSYATHAKSASGGLVNTVLKLEAFQKPLPV